MPAPENCSSAAINGAEESTGGLLICQPAASSGEEVAGRAGGRNTYAGSREPYSTGSLGAKKPSYRPGASKKVNEEDEFEDD